MNQIAFPNPVSYQELAREKTLGGAMGLCIKAGGFEPKEIIAHLKGDKAQVSRWVNDQEGILWKKLEEVMDFCGNDAPILWMLLNRGYDLRSLRKKETETEQQLREAKEQIAQLQLERQILVNAMHGKVAA